MKGLENRVALVTGASSGIGAACAVRLSQEGCVIVGLDVTRAEGGLWTDEEKTSFHVADVTEEQEIKAAIAAVIERHGKLDVVVNAAGVGSGGAVHALDTAEWDRVIGVNLKGTFLVCKHALAAMLERSTGSIVNIASIEGIEGTEGGSVYNASKGGVILLTKNMAIDYARKGIRVNCVCPGLVETQMTQILFAEGMETMRDRFIDAHQMGRTGKPEEMASAVAFLASEEASFITGHALVVDGGFTAGHRFGFEELMGLG